MVPAATGLERNGHDDYVEVPLVGPFSCWWQHTTGPRDRSSRILPDNSADFIVLSTGRSWFVGPAESADIAELSAGTEIRGLRIRPGCVGAVTRTGAHSLANRSVGIDDLIGARAAAVLIQAIWAGPAAEPVAAFTSVPVPRTRSLVRELLRDPTVPASTVAQRYALSERQLRRLVLDEAGLAPKTLQRVARMQLFLRAAEGRGSTLATAAASAGYADQSHLSRDVRQLAGVTPARLLAERRTRTVSA